MYSFVENSILGKNFLGIEIFSIANEERAAFLHITKRKNELLISKEEIYNSTDNLKSEKLKLPTAIIINSDQVLQKEVESVDSNDKKLLHKAFPNINLDEFYFEITRLEGFSILAICRKKHIDELIGSLENNFHIMQVQLGTGIIKQVLAYKLPDTLFTNNQIIELKQDSNRVRKDTISQVIYTINGLKVSNSYLLAFSGILGMLFKTETSSGNIIEYNSELTYQSFQKAFYNFSIRAGLGVILAILLINFIAFSYYFDKANAASTKLSLNKADIENMRDIRLRIKDKEEKVNTILSHSLSKSSLKINEIVKLVPHSVLLTGLNYNPIEKKIKENEAVLFQDKIIFITGNTISNEGFTEWIAEVEKLEWIKQVTILSFGKNQEGKTVFEFKIETM